MSEESLELHYHEECFCTNFNLSCVIAKNHFNYLLNSNIKTAFSIAGILNK